MTSLLNDAISDVPLFGDQKPRILYSPDAPTSAGEDAIDLAESFGLILDPWQRLVLNEALKEREDGLWAAPHVGLMVSRQNGKTAILEALILAGLFLWDERLIIFSAQLMDTSKAVLARMIELFQNSGQDFKERKTNGFEAVELIGGPNAGAMVMFRTRTGKGGLGMSADRVIFDEAMDIDRQAIQALIPTASARPNPQFWFTGSAVDQRMPAHTHCQQFGGMRQGALSALSSGKPARLCYMEWSIPDDDPPESLDYQKLAQANPALGYRLTFDKIEAEFESFERTGDYRGFAVQRYGWGDWPTFGANRSAISLEHWRTLADRPELDGENALVVYRSPNGGSWAIAGAQRTTDGRIHLEVGYAGDDPADAVIDKFASAVTAWGPCAVVMGRGGAAEEVARIEAAGIEVIVPNSTDEAQACGGFLNDVHAEGAKVISHAAQPGLENAISHAVKRDVPSGGFTWDCINDKTYAQLMAATLARWALIRFNVQTEGARSYEWPDDKVIQEWLDEEPSWMKYEEEF